MGDIERMFFGGIVGFPLVIWQKWGSVVDGQDPLLGGNVWVKEDRRRGLPLDDPCCLSADGSRVEEFGGAVFPSERVARFRPQ